MKKRARHVKHKLKNLELTLGSWITLGHPAIAEIMANAGFDWLAVDLEHSVITIKEAEELIRVIDLAGSVPLVRLTANNSNQIKRVMDAGAAGIIVPMVKTVDDALQAIEAVRYPTNGSRGFGLARAQGYGNAFTEYLNWESTGPIVILQIEHKEAVENLEAILQLDGVDGFIVGPYDLSGSMGIPGHFDHPEFLRSISRIKSVAQDLKVAAGIHVVEPNIDDLKQRIQESFTFVAYSIDIRILDTGFRQAIDLIRS